MAKATTANQKYFWSNTVGDRSLQVRIKADRTPLVWLRERCANCRPTQICQATISSFASEKDAVDLMIKVAEKALDGANKSELRAYRNELMATDFRDRVVQSIASKLRKRPASAPMGASIDASSHEKQEAPESDLESEVPVTPPPKRRRRSPQRPRPTWCADDFLADEVLGMDDYAFRNLCC